MNGDGGGALLAVGVGLAANLATMIGLIVYIAKWAGRVETKIDTLEQNGERDRTERHDVRNALQQHETRLVTVEFRAEDLATRLEAMRALTAALQTLVDELRHQQREAWEART